MDVARSWKLDDSDQAREVFISLQYDIEIRDHAHKFAESSTANDYAARLGLNATYGEHSHWVTRKGKVAERIARSLLDWLSGIPVDDQDVSRYPLHAERDANGVFKSRLQPSEGERTAILRNNDENLNNSETADRSYAGGRNHNGEESSRMNENTAILEDSHYQQEKSGHIGGEVLLENQVGHEGLGGTLAEDERSWMKKLSLQELFEEWARLKTLCEYVDDTTANREEAWRLLLEEIDAVKCCIGELHGVVGSVRENIKLID